MLEYRGGGVNLSYLYLGRIKALLCTKTPEITVQNAHRRRKAVPAAYGTCEKAIPNVTLAMMPMLVSMKEVTSL